MSGNAMLTMKRSRLERNAAALTTTSTARGRTAAALTAEPRPRRGGRAGPRPRGLAPASPARRGAGEPARGVGPAGDVVVEAVAVGGLQVERVDEQPQLLGGRRRVGRTEARDELVDQCARAGQVLAGHV